MERRGRWDNWRGGEGGISGEEGEVGSVKNVPVTVCQAAGFVSGSMS